VDDYIYLDVNCKTKEERDMYAKMPYFSTFSSSRPYFKVPKDMITNVPQSVKNKYVVSFLEKEY
jgi:hypothetical protein